MKPDENSQRSNSPILIELSIVFATIALLTALFVPALARAKAAARLAQAKTEMTTIMAAISAYGAAYGRFPTSSNAIGCPDFTFGTLGTSDETMGITNTSGYQANNSEIISILMDLDRFPNGERTVNWDHCRNPQRTPFLTAKMTSSTNSPGVGPDYVFRDPWGHPYIITIDLNGDRKCRDAFYRLASVSEIAGAAGTNILLSRPSPPPYTSDNTRNSFEITNVTVIVWSFGPDGEADKTQKASEGVNKDNITSW